MRTWSAARGIAETLGYERAADWQSDHPEGELSE
jgi:hypothetical protein